MRGLLFFHCFFILFFFSAPEAPVRLTFLMDIDNSKSRYILSWEKPFVTNGKLTNYELNILWNSDKSKTVFKKLVDALYTYYHTQRNDSRGIKFRVSQCLY